MHFKYDHIVITRPAWYWLILSPEERAAILKSKPYCKVEQKCQFGLLYHTDLPMVTIGYRTDCESTQIKISALKILFCSFCSVCEVIGIGQWIILLTLLYLYILGFVLNFQWAYENVSAVLKEHLIVPTVTQLYFTLINITRIHVCCTLILYISLYLHIS